MAIIGKIRERVGLLVFIIALAIVAFLLMDGLSSSGGGGGGVQQQAAGSLNGEPLSFNEYETRVQQLTNNYRQSGQTVDDATTYRLREQAWNGYVEEKISSSEAKKLGLSVTNDELSGLFMDPNNLHPTVKSTTIFQDESGNYSADRFKAYIRSFSDPNNPQAAQQRQIWKNFEQGVERSQLQDKYSSLISKAIYAPSFLATQDYTDKNKKANIKYIQYPYTDIADDQVSISDADLNTYLKANSAEFKQDEETREIEYVAFAVKPSKEDSLASKDAVINSIERFRTVDNVKSFISVNGSTDPYNDLYLLPGQFNSTEADAILSSAVGTVHGPYYENGAWKVARVVDKKQVADSASFRIITIAPNANLSLEQAEKKIDSLKTALDNGADFESLASQFSDDKSKESGGNMGYVKLNTLPLEMNAALFYEHQAGDVFTVNTQQGLNIIEIIDMVPSSEGVKVAVLGNEIVYSEETRDKAFREASSFITNAKSIDALREQAAGANLTVQKASDLSTTSYELPNLGVAQDVVTWAFKADKGAVCEKSFFVTKKSPTGKETGAFIVPALANIKSAGLPSLESVRSQIESKVRNEKKAALIKDKMTGGTLDAIASATGMEVKEANDVAFQSASIPGIGVEPQLQAAIASLDANAVSKPIAGERGVYVAQVTNITDAGSPADMNLAKTTAAQPLRQNVQRKVMNALTDALNVEDNRHKVRTY